MKKKDLDGGLGCGGGAFIGRGRLLGVLRYILAGAMHKLCNARGGGVNWGDTIVT